MPRAAYNLSKGKIHTAGLAKLLAKLPEDKRKQFLDDLKRREAERRAKQHSEKP